MCGVEYKHTFAVVDFGKNPNFDIILGRPFIRQLKMVQDWGFNYLYLRQESSVTRVKLKDHSSRDVARTSIKDFDIKTMVQTNPSWLTNSTRFGCAELLIKEMEKGMKKNPKRHTYLNHFPN